jgi:hypothetical protein
MGGKKVPVRGAVFWVVGILRMITLRARAVPRRLRS